MDETQLRLDGNAVAGLLQDLFGREVTDADGQCAACGATAEVGAQLLYMYPRAPGAVLRCRHCENVLMVVVHAGGRFRFGMPGLAWVAIGEVT
jgi:hypothetical protein